jgi:hypothetical protein
MISEEQNKIKPKSMERDENCSTLNMIIEISTFSQGFTWSAGKGGWYLHEPKNKLDLANGESNKNNIKKGFSNTVGKIHFLVFIRPKIENERKKLT